MLSHGIHAIGYNFDVEIAVINLMAKKVCSLQETRCIVSTLPDAETTARYHFPVPRPTHRPHGWKSRHKALMGRHVINVR